MTAPTYKDCACAHRPKCEALGPCGEYATTSEWQPDRGGHWRPVWLCDNHLAPWRNRRAFLHGIDRPAHADEYWRPSIMDHVRLTMIHNRANEPRPEPPVIDKPPRNLTPAQWATLRWLREAQA